MAQTDRRGFLAATAALAATTRPGFGSPFAGRSQPEEGGAPPPTDPISKETIRHAQRLIGLDLTEPERESVASGISDLLNRYAGRRKVELPNGLAPLATVRPTRRWEPENDGVVRSVAPAPPLPANDEDIAFAPLTHLSRWIESRALTSMRLTKIYLDRIKRIGPKLECIVTVTEDLALRQAQRADDEIASGNYRGPLHGIPWGAKDLFDTAGIPTTWGATPYKDRVPDTNAAVVRKLDEAGAVLIAKTTLGALAYGDIWFGGRTKNPWNLNQGSSGSSAGSAAGTAAGLFAFSLGTETYGSIVSPCMRCGATGLRPTFGRVARTGAMALCWSLDKVGPICRSVEDTMLVLDAIRGSDPGDASSTDANLAFDANARIDSMRVGYSPAWFDGPRSADPDRAAFDATKRLGVELVEIDIPDWPYDALLTILTAEAAAAFEELTFSNRDDELVWQEPEAWPNTFRTTWFIPAVELVQAERFRRRCADMMDTLFADNRLDAILSPSYAASLLLITNNTGHPCLTLRAGFRSNNRPHGVTLWGRPFDEGTIARLGVALEQELGVWDTRPRI